jgi:RND family efflux transporter MFP subunit
MRHRQHAAPTHGAPKPSRSSERSRTGVWSLGVCLPLVFLLACGAEEVDEGPAEPEVLSIKTLTIGRKGAKTKREYPGQLAAWQHSEMAFEVSGKIIDWRFTEGQSVTAGTILARLDPRDFQAGLKAAEANLARDKADFIRYETLFKKGVASESELDARTRRYEVRQAELEIATKRLEDADLVAPFDGVVAKKLVEDFENVVAKSPVLILQDLSKMKIRVAVPESDMAGSRNPGRPIDIEEINRRLNPEIVLTSLRDRVFPARLYELSLTADPVTRTFDATFLMDRQDTAIVLPGMTAKAVIHFVPESGSGLMIPANAVWADDAGKTHVWKIDPNAMTVSPNPVEVGALSGDRIAILSGIGDGDQIAVSGIQNLTDGRQVRPLDARLR